ncbi:MAG: 4'-phosphopantetheinyl transferase superfamily protein [Gammaproteobacteria bacterium]|nr:4'-phosphopantetheinyl transferase superfamily protein [Gammaproteobacteria bacterium]
MKSLAAAIEGLDHVHDHTLLSAGACHAVIGRVADHRSALSDDERQHIGHAVESRQLAYSTGRYLAKRALAELDVPVESIPTHPSRRPVWPDGVVGSITHSRRYGIAIVCRCSGLAGVGVDLELAGRVTEDIAESVMTEAERQVHQSDWPPSAYTANFSAKEAVFKAVNPIVGLMVGFREVEIRWLARERTFTASYVGPNRENAVIEGGRGTVFALDDHVGALFWIGAQAT